MNNSHRILVRVVAPRFVAGIELEHDRCGLAAPILRWCLGQTRSELRDIFARRGWTATIVPHQSEEA